MGPKHRKGADFGVAAEKERLSWSPVVEHRAFDRQSKLKTEGMAAKTFGHPLVEGGSNYTGLAIFKSTAA
jgi:hypothetical protein